MNGDTQAESEDPVLWQLRAILPLASLGKGFPSRLRGQRATAPCWCPRTVPCTIAVGRMNIQPNAWPHLPPCIPIPFLGDVGNTGYKGTITGTKPVPRRALSHGCSWDASWQGEGSRNTTAHCIYIYTLWIYISSLTGLFSWNIQLFLPLAADFTSNIVS